MATTRVVGLDQARAAYSAAVTQLDIADVASDDIFAIKGSATKIVRVQRIAVTGVTTTAPVAAKVVLWFNSTANSAGTSVTAVPYAVGSPAATALVESYTANPTPGTRIGRLMSRRISFPASASVMCMIPVLFEFNVTTGPIVLIGTSQQLSVSLDGVSHGASAFFDCDVQWTEE